MLKLIFIFVLLVPVLCVAQVCKNQGKISSYQNAITSCLSQKSKKATDKTLSLFLKLNDSSFCQVASDKDSTKSLLDKLCQDPNGTACLNKGEILDSQCNYMALDIDEAESAPEFMRTMCEAEGQWKDFAKTKMGECSAKDESKCFDFLSLKHAEAKAKIFRDRVYTKERVAKVRQVFSEVKNVYAEIIQRSKKMSPAVKKMLLTALESTSVALDEKTISGKEFTDCFNVSPGKTSTSAYNHSVKDSFQREIHVCSGMMANLDQINPYSFIHVMAHELSHSFDPCTLEHSQLLQGSPIPNIYAYVYPDTVKCLRGGKGTHGCEGAALNCNSSQGRIDLCKKDYKGEEFEACVEQVKLLPNCPLGVQEEKHNDNNSADYRKKGSNLEQIGESFSDFMAAEVVSQIIDRTSPSESAKTDALLSISAAASRLHGVCLTKNTPDSHPPGFLRMNRVFMSNESFRKSIGCLKGPPKTPKAGLTCPGI